MAASSSARFSPGPTPSKGVMSPTMASARSCTRQRYCMRCIILWRTEERHDSQRYEWSETLASGMPRNTHPLRRTFSGAQDTGKSSIPSGPLLLHSRSRHNSTHSCCSPPTPSRWCSCAMREVKKCACSKKRKVVTKGSLTAVVHGYRIAEIEVFSTISNLFILSIIKKIPIQRSNEGNAQN